MTNKPDNTEPTNVDCTTSQHNSYALSKKAPKKGYYPEVTSKEVLRFLNQENMLVDLEGDEQLYLVDTVYPNLLAIETYTKHLLNTTEPAFTYVSKAGHSPSVENNKLSVRAALKIASYALDDNKDYCPLIQLFKDCMAEHFDPTETFNHPHHITSTGNLLCVDINKFVETLRSRGKGKEFNRKMADHQAAYKHRMKKSEELIYGLFSTHSKLTVMRVDLYLGKQRNEHLNLEYCLNCYQRFLNNQRHNTIFENKVGYIAKLEFTEHRGYHYHFVFFFDGQKVIQDSYYANLICNYWIDGITKGRGTANNCNKDPQKYARYGMGVGIGVIDYRDKDKIANLLYAVSYLAKSDQYILEKACPKQKTFVTSQLPPPKSNRGRPRKNPEASFKRAPQASTNSVEVQP